MQYRETSCSRSLSTQEPTISYSPYPTNACIIKSTYLYTHQVYTIFYVLLGASLSRQIGQLQTMLQSGSCFSMSNFVQLISCPYEYIKYLQGITFLDLTVNVSSLNQLGVSYMSRTIKRFSTGLCQAPWDRRTTTSRYKLKILPEKKTDQRKTFQINHTSRGHNQKETLQRLCQEKKSLFCLLHIGHMKRLHAASSCGAVRLAQYLSCHWNRVYVTTQIVVYCS